MVPGEYDIKIYRGSTWSITISAVDAVGVDTNFATNYITDGGLIRMQIRPEWVKKPIPEGSALFELTIANGRIELQSGDEEVKLTISAADTAALKFNSDRYDLELVTGDGVPVVDKILYGKVTVTGEITI